MVNQSRWPGPLRVQPYSSSQRRESHSFLTLMRAFMARQAEGVEATVG